jgi:hypothetical protein
LILIAREWKFHFHAAASADGRMQEKKKAQFARFPLSI